MTRSNSKHALLLTYQDVAAVTQLSESTVKRLSASGELPHVKLGKPKLNRVRDNRPVRFRVNDVAKLTGMPSEDIQAALADVEGGAK